MPKVIQKWHVEAQLKNVKSMFWNPVYTPQKKTFLKNLLTWHSKESLQSEINTLLKVKMHEVLQNHTDPIFVTLGDDDASIIDENTNEPSTFYYKYRQNSLSRIISLILIDKKFFRKITFCIYIQNVVQTYHWKKNAFQFNITYFLIVKCSGIWAIYRYLGKYVILKRSKLIKVFLRTFLVERNFWEP